MSIQFVNSAIEKTTAFHERVKYDVSNNLISAQFDGVGGVSKYAVMNKFSVFSAYYALFSVDGKAFDWSGEKKVTMLGRTQKTEFSFDGAKVVLTQFLDGKSNAVFNEVAVSAERDLTFGLTINYGIDFASYVQQLLANRLSAGNIFKIIAGFLKKKRETLEGAGLTYFKGNVLGDFYIDFAFGGKAKGLESERGCHNQFALEEKIIAGDSKNIRYVFSAGTRSDYTFSDVADCLKSFDKAKAQAEEYANLLRKSAPAAADSDMLKAYYASLLNCSLSNYKELLDFKGFLAGIVYQFPARTYFRDAYWTVLSVLPVKPRLVRNEIITLAKGVDKKTGACPSAVKFNFKNHWGDHYDSPSFFVMMVYDYIAATGDKTILFEKIKGLTVFDICEKVIDNLSKKTDESGLLLKSGQFNRRDWCDNVFRTGYVTYDESLYARALYCLSEIAKSKGEKEKSASYAARFEDVRTAINNILWDEEKGWYVNYRDGDFVEDNLSIDTIVAVIFGIADKTKAKRILENMERLLESKNNSAQGAGDFGTLCVYPFYKESTDIVQKSSLPYYYHNGGDWPYLSAVYAYAKKKAGMDWEYPLTRWFLYNLEKGNYTPIEFFSPLHPDGSLLQAWSSTGAFALSYADEDFFGRKL